MKLGIEFSRGAGTAEDRAGSIEDPRVAVSDTKEFLSFFGLDGVTLPRVTIDKALTVPAVTAAVTFLSRTLAALPLHAYRGNGERVKNGIESVIHDAWSAEFSSFAARQYFWQGVFTGGRGLAWLEWSGGKLINIWPMEPGKTTVKRRNGRKIYTYDGKDYDGADVVDVPFMLKPDQLGHYGPITMAAKAIQLALAMNAYAANFFAGGGVPPLALVGTLPSGKDARLRAINDVHGAIEAAKASNKPIFPIPSGYELKPVGFDPAKGQMEAARLFQIQEIARAFQIPPVFLQDLSKGTFANVEQQDLHLVKHLVGQWAKALEAELTLKICGRGAERRGQYIEHNLDGLMRGDFKSRTEAMARAIQTSQMTPNEARALDNRAPHKNSAADELLVQGATVVLGSPAPTPEPPLPDDEEVDADDPADPGAPPSEPPAGANPDGDENDDADS